jgi:Tol biopolymer transport system component
MLRFVLHMGFWLTAGLAVIGALISRQWGWPEYASDELYVVYGQVNDTDTQYFIIDINGDKNIRLHSNNGAVTAVACSPDGRRFAFLTDTAHLYSLNYDGLEYEVNIPPHYQSISIANSGMILTSGRQQPDLLVEANQMRTLLLPQRNIWWPIIEISSDGSAIYPNDDQLENRLHIASLDTLKTTFVIQDTHNTNAQWLASEQLLVYTHIVSMRSYQRMLLDVGQQKQVRLAWTDIFDYILSPDGMLLAFSGEQADRQIYLTSPFSKYFFEFNHDGYYPSLTHNHNVDSIPICFLTFRPQMLIAENQ